MSTTNLEAEDVAESPPPGAHANGNQSPTAHPQATELIVPDPSPDVLPEVKLVQGDARHLPPNEPFLDDSVDLVVTSPPYWQKRDYGVDDQIGQEATPQEFTGAIVDCLKEWRRVLRPTGSVFLNIGDTFHKRQLAGIPARVEAAAGDDGWIIRNRIIWAKDGGMPEPAQNRLANRHEYIIHLVPKHEYYYDIFGYARAMGNGANPGDVWRWCDTCGSGTSDAAETFLDVVPNWRFCPTCGRELAHDPEDVWRFNPGRHMGKHLAPFPTEIVRRAILLACPISVCEACGTPRRRCVEPTDQLDPARAQARRAMEIAREAGLTAEHLAAVRATGVSDAGKALKIQNGTGRNAAEVKKLAAEAKAVLGGYFREFTFSRRETVDWTRCGCDARQVPGTVFDPFMGTGTTLKTALAMGRSVIGLDLDSSAAQVLTQTATSGSS